MPGQQCSQSPLQLGACLLQRTFCASIMLSLLISTCRQQTAAYKELQQRTVRHSKIQAMADEMFMQKELMVRRHVVTRC